MMLKTNKDAKHTSIRRGSLEALSRELGDFDLDRFVLERRDLNFDLDLDLDLDGGWALS